MTRDTLETALTLLAESDRSGRATVTHTQEQIRHAFAVAVSLEALARGFKRREEDRCSFPLTDARQAAYDRADAKAAEKARDALAPWRVAVRIGGDVRGSQIHILTPRTGRANTMGGREAGWAV
jgi:hypothetical protein